VKDSALTGYVLPGLPLEYDSLVTSVTTRLDPVSMTDLYGHLLTHEQRIEAHHSSPDLSLSNVNAAQRQSSSPSPSRGRGFSSNYRGRGRGRGRGSPSSGIFNPNRPICQICQKLGHTANRCYSRFDHSYQQSPAGPSAAFSAQQAIPDSAWYNDTGSTHHITNDLSNLNMRAEEYTGTDQIRVGNGQGLSIQHTGSACLPSRVHNFSLQSLLHVPQIQKNLISIFKFTIDNHVFVEFHPSCFRVKDLRTRKLLLQGPSRDGLYPWPSTALSLPSSPHAFLGERVSVDLWHNRFGHPALRVVRAVLSKFSLPISTNKAAPVCSSCQQGKLHKFHFPLNSSVSAHPLDLLFLDVWGPAPVVSSNNKRYFLCIVEDYSHYSWLFPLSCKSEVLHVFTKFKLLVENYFQSSIKSVQTDGGGEFIPVQRLLSAHGISYRQTCPHTHHQNGSVERKLRHIVDNGLALLSHASIPLKFWDSAFDTASYLNNRLPSSNNPTKSPFELLFNTAPNYHLLKVFGCECLPYLRPYNSSKFSYRSKSCLFLGYSKPHVGYICFHPPSGRIYIARHVVFNETMFPFASVSSSSVAASSSISPPSIPLMSPTLPISVPADSVINKESISVPCDPAPSPAPATIVPSPPDHPVPTQTHAMTTRAQNNVFCPKPPPAGFIRYPIPQSFHVSLGDTESEPTSYTHAAKSEKWRAAMAEEFNALLRNGTWTLVTPTASMNLVGSKWVFKIKRKSDGTVDRYKARLVAKGFHQQHGLDFDETYSPVVKPITIRTVLSMALTKGWCLKQIDISNAFLHGVLQETVYMSQPPGFVHPSFPGSVCHLKKAIYGLKQAPRAWYSQLSSKLHELGFKSCKLDSSLFILRTSIVTLFALVYVDDIILTGSTLAAMDALIRELSTVFPVKDLGDLNFFLGVEVTRVSTGILLSQQRYICDILKRTNLSLVKPISSPLSAATSLSKFSGSTFEDPTLYRQTVGALQYLSLTRPDIGFAVSKVSQFMHEPHDLHWTAVKRILRYLKSTADYGLFINKCSSSQLYAYSDADWAGCPDDRKSTSGYCIYLGSNLFSWSSKKQPTVSRSSTEAEYKAIANTTAEMMWIQSLFRDIGLVQHAAPILYCDNIGATYLSSNPAYHARTKHIEIDYHFVRDKVAEKALVVRFLSNKDQIADVLTKPLVSTRFCLLRSNLNVHSTLRLRGHIRTSTHEDSSSKEIQTYKDSSSTKSHVDNPST
jgi:hypothetical protein